MRRRDFLAGAAGAAAWPLAARGQQGPALPVIGILGSTSAATSAAIMAELMQGLNGTGFQENQNFVIEQRWANNQYGRLPEMAADLVRARVSVIVTVGNNLPARAAKAATSTIPIVFVTGVDPMAVGLVPSFNRPGGNITGIAGMAVEVLQKRMQMLHELVQSAKRFGYLFNPDNIFNDIAPVVEAVSKWGGTLELAEASDVTRLDAAFSFLAARHVEAIATSADAFFFSEGERLNRLTLQYGIPVICAWGGTVKAGGLISYSAAPGNFRQAGLYAGRILKGEKPGDLPVMQPTKFEFVINVKTARALGIQVPPTLLAIADEVIE